MKRRMISRRILSLCLVLGMMCSVIPLNVFAAEDVPPAQEEVQYPYQDTTLSAQERALDLVSRMTPEEKYAQLRARTAPAIPRLEINAYDWWSEALHGVARDGRATSFPTGLGIGATWDVDLVEQMMVATSDEARDKFNNHVNDHGLSYWSPTINMARDPRWGRAEETYGEDPYLSGMIAEAFINGLQGGDPDYYKAIATPKHFLGNNSEQNRHNGSADIDERDLREYYTQAFKYAVEESHAGSVMSSYNAVNGVPMSANREIIENIVRRTWGFDGYMVTDCGALNDIVSNHKWRPDGWGDQPWGGKETAAYAIMAGTDLNCGGVLPGNTGAAVEAGLLSEDDVDKALVRLFTARMKTGEFDPDGGIYGDITGTIQSAANQKLAEDGADNAVVLLQNKDNTLPLENTIKNLVLVGDTANELILGDYSTNQPENTSTAVQGIEAALKRANPDAAFTYIEGKQSGGSQYMMNTRGPKLLDAEGNVLRQIDLSKNSGTSGCKIENSPFNIGYTSPGCWVKFNAGTIDFADAASFSVEMSGDNSQPTQLEIRAVDPKTGPLLGTVATPGNTGGWGNYVTYPFDASLGGGYTDQPIYIVLNAIPQDAKFTEAEKASITAADAVVFFAGTRPGENGYAEERDGANLDLPNSQTAAINTVAKLNANTIVYMQTVSQVNVEPFKDQVQAILWSTYNGQAQGNAAGRLLFGEANPSAKLPFTWYTDIDQLADIKDYQIRADESNNGRTYQYFVGDVTYPFGYGLSYSTFEYSNLSLSKSSVTPDDTVTVEFDVKNTGAVDGQEVAELYVISPDAAENDRPAKRLRGFDKQAIAAGETAHFSIELPVCELWFWDADNDVQTYDQGAYTIQVGPDSAAAALTATLDLSGQLTPKLNVVTAIPSGHILDTENMRKTITSDLSACNNDQSFVDLDAADVLVAYTSSNTDVASVSQNGVVAAVGGGLATITASVTADGVTKTSSFPVLVDQSVYADNICIDGRDLTGYDPNVFGYNVAVEDFDTFPTVTADVKDSFEVEIEQATAENHSAAITLTLGEESVVYTIQFIKEPKSFDFTKTSEEEFRDVWNIYNENPDNWKLDENGLTLTTQRGDIYTDSTDVHNLFTQAAAGDWVMDTKVDFEYLPQKPYQQAAIMAYQDMDNYVKLSYEYGGSAPVVQFGYEAGGVFANGFRKNLEVTALYYRLEKVGSNYTGYYSVDGETYEKMGTQTMDLKNPQIALLAVNSYQDAPPMDATFAYMDITKTTNCTCALYDLATDADQSFGPQGTTPVTHEMSADVKVRGGCQVEGHEPEPVITYELLPGSESTAAIEGNILTMPRSGKVNVRVTASLNEAEPIYWDVAYKVTGNNVDVMGSGARTSGAGAYQAGDTVTIDAGNLEGYSFIEWTASSEAVVFEQKNSLVTTFTMPAQDVTVQAVFEKIPEHTIEVTADKLSVQAGEDVTVTVTAKGSAFVGAACKLSFESDKFVLKSAPDGWEAGEENSYGYYNVISDGFYPGDTVLGDFIFTARGLEDETTGSFSLSDTYVAGEWEDGWSTDPAEQVPNNGSVDVEITLAPAYEVEIVEDYVAGYSLVLVYTDRETGAYAYDGQAMYDVTHAGYECGGAKYAHVYGLVVKGMDADPGKVADAAKSAGTLTYSTDVNASGKTDINDAVAVVAVYNANGMYMDAIHMDIVLKADVNQNKKVDVDDFGLVKAEYT